jgi:hypothetical protein
MLPLVPGGPAYPKIGMVAPAMIDWLRACFRDEPAERRLGDGVVDPLSREQIAHAARLLRSIRAL